MGSGLVKCFITSQTIPEGIPVVVFPIIQQTDYEPVKAIHSYQMFHQATAEKEAHFTDHTSEKEIMPPNSSICYANCFYRFQGVKFHALADDYRRQNLENTLENRISFLNLLKYLHQHALKTLPGENQYHDHGFEIQSLLKEYNISLGDFNERGRFQYHKDTDYIQSKALDWDKVQELYLKFLDIADEGRIIVIGLRRPVVLKFAICLQSAYDEMVRLAKHRDYRSYYNIDEAIDEACAAITPNMSEEDKQDAIFSFRSRINHSATELTANGYSSQLFEELDVIRKDFTVANIKALKPKMSFLFDFISMQEILNKINVPILPMTGYDQDYQNENGKLFTNIVTSSQNAVDSFIKEKYGEYEEEE